MTTTGAHRQQRGFVLAESLAALALLALQALAIATLVHGAVWAGREAERLDRAREAAQAVIARSATVSWHRLPELFGAADDAVEALLDTADGSAPVEWGALVAALPEGRIVARLEGIAEGGGSAPFDAGLALRVRVEVSYAVGTRRRSIALTAVRF